MTLRRLTAGATVGAVLALTMAVYGSSSATASSSAHAAKTTTAKLSGAPLRLGVICSCTGFAASTDATYPSVIQAWSQYVKANGGINGHPVEIFFKDDANDAATALKDAQTLVQADHVQAIVDLSQQDAAFEKYVTQAGVPVTGGESQNPPFTSSSDFFPTGGDTAGSLGYGEAVIAKANGETKFGALVCAEAPICAGFFGPFGGSLQNIVGGMSLAYSATIAGSAPNYTAQCLAAQQAGVQAMFIGDSVPVIQRVIDDCAQQGIKISYFIPAAPLPILLNDPHANGVTTPSFNLPAFNTSTPGGRLFNQIISRYAPSARSNAAWSDADVRVFAGLELFRLDATKNKLSASSTPAQVKAGLYALKGTTLGGVAPPLTYVKGKVTNVTCWFNVQISSGKEVTPSGPKAQCVPASKVAALLKAFGG